jgi:hypothetical protein
MIKSIFIVFFGKFKSSDTFLMHLNLGKPICKIVSYGRNEKKYVADFLFVVKKTLLTACGLIRCR